MSAEKTDYSVQMGDSRPPAFDHPAFPVTFGTSVRGPQMNGGATAPDGLPYPQPTAFAQPPVVPGAYGLASKPQGGGSVGFVNPNYPSNPAPPYSPPASGFVDNYSGKQRELY